MVADASAQVMSVQAPNIKQNSQKQVATDSTTANDKVFTESIVFAGYRYWIYSNWVSEKS
jgi:hypothetical protein